MTTETMSVHKALAELKTLDARIRKAMQDCVYVVANKHSNTKIFGVDIHEYVDRTKAGYAKVRDLIRRREALKKAIVMSNAKTEVTIAGVTYTVAEAIEMKNNGVVYLQNLLSKMRTTYLAAQQEVDRHNSKELDDRVMEYVKNLFGNQTDMKNMATEVEEAKTAFIKAQTYELVDPIGVSAECEKLEQEIQEFLVDVDAALSVSNSLTQISVEY